MSPEKLEKLGKLTKLAVYLSRIRPEMPPDEIARVALGLYISAIRLKAHQLSKHPGIAMQIESEVRRCALQFDLPRFAPQFRMAAGGFQPTEFLTPYGVVTL